MQEGPETNWNPNGENSANIPTKSSPTKGNKYQVRPRSQMQERRALRRRRNEHVGFLNLSRSEKRVGTGTDRAMQRRSFA